MAVKNFKIASGLSVRNGHGTASSGIDIIFGVNLPGSLQQEIDAPVGSLYARLNGEEYIKRIAGAGTANWKRVATVEDLNNINWRSENAIALTSDAAPLEGGTIDLAIAPFTDDQAPTLTGANFAIGDLVLFGNGGTPVAAMVSNVAVDVLTFTFIGVTPLVSGDNFIVDFYLPNSPSILEGKAMVNFNGTSYVKIADVNWDFATGIKLSSAYATASGNITSADSVESAIEKLDGNNDSQDLTMGVAQGALNMGTYSGSIIPANGSIKANIQALENEVGGNRQVLGAVTTLAPIDSVLVDNVKAVEWIVYVELDSAPSRKVMFRITAMHDGTVASDAVSVDDTEYAELEVGASFDFGHSVTLSGAGAAQTMALNVSATLASSFVTVRKSIF